MVPIVSSFLLWVSTVCGQTDSWQQAEQNARQAAQAIHLAHRNSCAWLSHADRTTGLLPRNLKDSPYWNTKDCAADNYPFITLTAYLTDDYYLKQAVQHILAQEQKYTCRLDSLSDDFLFTTQKFRTEQPEIPSLIFGAAEYAKDGLNPITEWMGPSPWLPRMEGLIADVWKHAPGEKGVRPHLPERPEGCCAQMGSDPFFALPSDDVEVNGDLLQCMGRLYWLTGKNEYKDWCFRLADHHLFENSLLNAKAIKLRDHGCEIIGGLTEAYAIAVQEDPERAQRYKPKLHALLDNILAGGLDENGLMYNVYDPQAGRPVKKALNDGWGYVYNGFLTVAMIDNEPKYRAAVERALANIHKYKGNPFGSSIDDLADSTEGAINLMNRLPDASAAAWVDESMKTIFAAQQPDGTMEGWYGDGNSSRTALMYALWKTQGVSAAPWVEELQLGATRDQDGTLCVWAKSPYSWSGHLRFDRPRHREFMRLPLDYPRINQFPEWFTVDRLGRYSVQEDGGEAKTVTARELYMYAVTLKAKQPLKLTVKPLPRTLPARAMRYRSGSGEAAVAWQKELRGKLFDLMKLSDLRKAEIPFDAKVADTTDKGDYTLQEMTLRSTPGRAIKVLFALPKGGQGPFPAVVCIHGHGGVRQIVYDETSIYRGFADALARKGFITIATDVAQHEVYEDGRTLMGERLWDLMRCVDYLASRSEVDKKHIGCGGLSLGGEMAMWLGAMDERIAATVSSGYLTTMDQMEVGHCMCWKFDGLRDLADWADIYGLIAPRALQCQNGFAETMGGFNVPLARQALREIRPIYKDLNAADKVQLLTHPEGHVVNLPGLMEFLERNLKGGA